jgi:hypothetical protein
LPTLCCCVRGSAKYGYVLVCGCTCASVGWYVSVHTAWRTCCRYPAGVASLMAERNKGTIAMVNSALKAGRGDTVLSFSHFLPCAQVRCMFDACMHDTHSTWHARHARTRHEADGTHEHGTHTRHTARTARTDARCWSSSHSHGDDSVRTARWRVYAYIRARPCSLHESRPSRPLCPVTDVA